MFYDAIKKLILLLFPESLELVGYSEFIEWLTIAFAVGLIFIVIVLPFYRLTKYGLFGDSKRNKKF